MRGERRRTEASAEWDVVVVGAGPAGSIAARQLALAGTRVLLVDKARFPRDKVCGCCLGGAARAALASVGLGDLPARVGARPLRRMRVAAGGRSAVIGLSSRVALSRRRLDGALTALAGEAGVVFQDGTSGAWLASDAEGVELGLRSGEARTVVRAKVVLVADGLSGRTLAAHPACRADVRPRSRIGAGVTLDHASPDYPSGSVFMAVGTGGYVGLVRLEDGRLDVAAAFDPAFVRASGGPGCAAAFVLKEAGMPALGALSAARWQGTPTLTRRRAVAADRTFVLGDAAAYAEPFTGEGIGWALSSGIAAAPLALEGVRRWRPSLGDEWIRTHARLVGRRQRTCRIVSQALRSPSAAAWAVRALAIAPGAASPLVRWIDRVSAGARCGSTTPEVAA